MKSRADYPRGSGESPSLRTIFLGGIPLSSNDITILDYLSGFDIVEYVEIPKDEATNKPKGYAKALLSTARGTQRVLAQATHSIQGLSVGISMWKTATDYIKLKDQVENKKLYVRYENATSHKSLKEFFQRFGRIISIDHKRSPQTNQERNFCYITFEKIESAKAVLQRRVHRVQGKLVVCELSKPAHTAKKHKILQQIQKSTSQVNHLENYFIKTLYAQDSPDAGEQSKADNDNFKKMQKEGFFFHDFNDEYHNHFHDKYSSQIHGKHQKNNSNLLNGIHTSCQNLLLIEENKEENDKGENSSRPYSILGAKPTSRHYHTFNIKQIELNHLNPDNMSFVLQQK